MNDMWRMIWQLKCSRIVMVSNLVEDGRVSLTHYTWFINNNNNDRLTAFDPGQPG